MSIAHHLDDATLMSCAAGTLPGALAAVAAAHIAVCRQCRNGLAQAECLGGAILGSLDPVALGRLSPAPSQETTSDDETWADRILPARLTSGEVPQPLARLVGDDLDAIRWRPLGVGVWQHRVPLPCGPAGEAAGDLRLIKVSPGASVPAHGHDGMELTLVLRGSYRDEIGSFAEGDIADLDETVEHQPVAHAATGCICVLACERPARFHGLLARLLQPLSGL